jgi:hypothetical protein
MIARLLSVILLAVTLTACNALMDGMAHSKAVSDKLEKTVGLKSFVGFQWKNESLTSVTVTFQGIPAEGTLADIAEKSRQAVVEEFKQTPEQIVIGFVIKPRASE